MKCSVWTYSKPIWRHLNSKSKQYSALSRIFSSIKALNRLLFKYINLYIETSWFWAAVMNLSAVMKSCWESSWQLHLLLEGSPLRASGVSSLPSLGSWLYQLPQTPRWCLQCKCQKKVTCPAPICLGMLLAGKSDMTWFFLWQWLSRMGALSVCWSFQG